MNAGGIKAPAFLLGFALSGFFDGILLHQILQWHHLLSLVDRPFILDLRMQILADGLFHALMYLIALGALIWLWRRRSLLAANHATRRFLGYALIGFGAWNITDALLFHWLLQIHRIRIDTASPMAWDLAWVAVFGLGFTIAGKILLKSRLDNNRLSHRSPDLFVIAVTVTVSAAGYVAALPPPDTALSSVMFRSGTTPAQALHAIDAVGGRLVAVDRSETVWIVHVEEKRRTWLLYRHGALLVGNAAFGCLPWIRA